MSKSKKPKKNRYRKPLIAILVALTVLWGWPDVSKFYINRRKEMSIVILTGKEHRGGGTGFELEYGKHHFTVTNAHVCDMVGKDGYMEAFSPWANFEKIKILHISNHTDLCFLEPISGLPTLKLRSHEFQKGDKVQVWGHPRLRPLEKAQGKIKIASHYIDVMLDYINSSKDEKACHKYKNRIEYTIFGPICAEHVRSQLTSAQIEPGNSGSPVFDENGLVGGVAFAGQAGMGRTSDGEIIPWASLYLELMFYTYEYVGLE